MDTGACPSPSAASMLTAPPRNWTMATPAATTTATTATDSQVLPCCRPVRSRWRPPRRPVALRAGCRAGRSSLTRPSGCGRSAHPGPTSNGAETAWSSATRGRSTRTQPSTTRPADGSVTDASSGRPRGNAPGPDGSRIGRPARSLTTRMLTRPSCCGIPTSSTCRSDAGSWAQRRTRSRSSPGMCTESPQCLSLRLPTLTRLRPVEDTAHLRGRPTTNRPPLPASITFGDERAQAHPDRGCSTRSRRRPVPRPETGGACAWATGSLTRCPPTQEQHLRVLGRLGRRRHHAPAVTAASTVAWFRSNPATW